MNTNHDMHFGVEHHYMPPTDSGHEDGEWIDTIEDDGLGIGD